MYDPISRLTFFDGFKPNTAICPTTSAHVDPCMKNAICNWVNVALFMGLQPFIESTITGEDIKHNDGWAFKDPVGKFYGVINHKESDSRAIENWTHLNVALAMRGRLGPALDQNTITSILRGEG